MPTFLGYSYSYTIRVSRGLVVVDLGWNSDEAWDAFCLGVDRAGGQLDDIVGVVLTHTHPDHFGLAGRIREHTGAWIAGHVDEATNILDTDTDRESRNADLVAWLRQCGVPADLVADLASDALAVTVSPLYRGLDFFLDDGDLVPDTDGSLRAIHTPGHTPGHLCFFDESRSLLFSGDHLLPRVSPNISKRPGQLDDPLAAYDESLDIVAKLPDAVLALPGHEWAFDRVRDRIMQVRAANHDRAKSVLAAVAVAAGAATVWQVAHEIRWSRPFESLNVRGKRQALGETYAHLHHLERQRQIRSVESQPVRWVRSNHHG